MRTVAWLLSALIFSSAVSIKAQVFESLLPFCGAKLTGWYNHCDDFNPSLYNENRSCNEQFLTRVTPTELDFSGHTCYINPLHPQPNVVIWFGPLRGQEVLDVENQATTKPLEIGLFALSFGHDSVARYIPKSFNDTGAISCDLIEPLRRGWDDTSCDRTLNGWCNAFEDVYTGEDIYCQEILLKRHIGSPLVGNSVPRMGAGEKIPTETCVFHLNYYASSGPNTALEESMVLCLTNFHITIPNMDETTARATCRGSFLDNATLAEQCSEPGSAAYTFGSTISVLAVALASFIAFLL